MAEGINRIMRFPRGLLDLLQTKSLGANPPEYPPLLQVGIDVYQHYLPTPEVATTSTVGIVAVANAAIVTVPAGEVWVVRMVAGRVTSTLGGGVQSATLMVQPSGTGVSIAMADRVTTPALAVGESFRQGGYLPEAFVASPGTLWLNRIDQVNGTIDAQTLILYSRLLV